MGKAVRTQDVQALLRAPTPLSLCLCFVPAGGRRQALIPCFTDGTSGSRWQPGPESCLLTHAASPECPRAAVGVPFRHPGRSDSGRSAPSTRRRLAEDTARPRNE